MPTTHVIRIETTAAVSAIVAATAALRLAVEELEALAVQISEAGAAPAEGEE